MECELNPVQFGMSQYRQCLLPEPDYVSMLSDEVRQFFLERVQNVSEEFIKEEEKHEQGSDAWKRARHYRLPGSKHGAIVQHCPHTSDLESLADEMIYGTFQGNKYTEYGNETEPTARSRFIVDHLEWIKRKIRQARATGKTHYVYAGKKRELPVTSEQDTPDSALLRVEVTGTHVCRTHKWLSCSSDGDVNDDTLVEIKCPYKKGPYPLIPIYYFDQLQINMHIRRRYALFFFVYTSKLVTCDLVIYDPDYCNGFLVPALNRFYFTMYLPKLFAKEKSEMLLIVPSHLPSTTESIEGSSTFISTSPSPVTQGGKSKKRKLES